MKQSKCNHGSVKQLIILAFILVVAATTAKAQYYFKNPRATFRYSELTLGTAKHLYVRSNLLNACLLGDMPVNRQIKKANINVVFNWNTDFNSATTNQYTLDYTISGYSSYSGTSGLVMTYNASVVINNNQPQAVVNLDFTGLYNSINRFVVTPVLASSSINNAAVHGFISSDVSYTEEFEYNVYSGTSGTSTMIDPDPLKIAGDNLLTFSWHSRCDLNGVPPNYEFQLLKLYNSSNATKTSESDITADVDWSKALTIETGNSKTELSLTMAEGTGYYVWRVRPIGNAYEGGIANDHNWGLWTGTGSLTQGNRVHVSGGTSPYLFYFSYNAVDPYNPSVALVTGPSGPYPASTYSVANDAGRNWIFQRNFVEGDKVGSGQVTIGESIGYANKLQMANQQQSRIMSDTKKVISQSIYDYSGRAALNVLPTPVNKNNLSYEPGFIRNSSNNTYSAFDFDYSNAGGTGNYNNPSPMDSVASAGGLTSPSMYYSSNNDNEDNIATAAGYPFARTVFSKDGKNTAIESSMPGKEHRLNPATGAIKHTNRLTEAGVADIELVRIFGDEAPDENSVYKTVTFDPNNTASVAYISKEGKTIATCLSSPGTGSLIPLASASSNPFTVSTDITSSNSAVGQYAFHAFKTLALTEQTNVTLTYSLTPNTYSDPSCIPACSTCDYKVTFRITDNSGEAAPVVTSQVVAPPGSGCAQTPVNTSTVISLQAGSYTIERIIEANTAPSGSSVTYLTSFVQAAQSALNSNLLTGTGTIVDDAGVPVPGAPSVVLQNVFAYVSSGNLKALYAYMDVLQGDTHKNVKIGCNVIRIPIWPCEAVCDPNNLNFEAYFYNLYTPAGLSNQDKLDAMFGAGTYTVGDFDNVIKNMFSYGGYTCETLWNCWKGTVAYFMALHNTTNPQPPISLTIPGGSSYTPGPPDYLDQFLSCTGYKIGGIKTTAGSGVGPESAGGYKTHPYKWINYSSQCCACEVAFVNTYATCGVSLPPSCPVTITGSGATCGTAASFITWFNSIGSALALPCTAPTTDNKESFYRCVRNNQNSGSAGSCNVQSSPNHIDVAVAGDLLTACRNHCEGLYSQFITSEISLIHNGGTHIAGDPWELVAVPGGYEPGTSVHAPNVADLPLAKVYCNADAMMRFCKSQCVLTVQSPSGALGSAAEIAAVQNLLSGKFVRSSVIPCSGGNTNASLVSDSVARTIILMLNHNLANKRQQVGPAGGWWDFKTFLNNVNPTYSSYFSSLNVFVHPDIPSYFVLRPGSVTGNRISYYFNKSQGSSGTLSEKQIYSKDLVVSSSNFIYSLSGTSPVSAIVSDPGTDYIFSSASSATFVPVSAAPVGTIMSVPNALADAQINTSPAFAITYTTNLNGYTNGTSTKGYWAYNLCSSDITGSNAPYCDASVCFTIEPALTTAPPGAYVFDGTPPSCEVQTLNDMASSINSQLTTILGDYATKLKGIYKTQCVQNLVDRYTASYQLNYHHYTLYYYDRAGNLVKTVPPAGVNTTAANRMTHPAHAMITEYEYNSLSQLVRQKTPDGGETKFLYDAKGRLRFSQNAEQFNTNVSKFSYTKYDALGRIIDVGEIIDPAVYVNINVMSFPAPSAGTDITRTFYSTPVPGIMYPGNKPQRFLQNRVSYSFTDRDGNTGTIADLVATYYSYDPHGNVEWIIQDIPELGKNYIAYEYDLASGSVVKVRYNEHFNDRFFHRYTYDADKRIKTVETSVDDVIWEKDATYSYYLHGPLKRTLTGHDAIQGLDYAYTVNGWLKTLNGYGQSGDPGGDGSLADNNMYVPRDAYSFVLGYHKNDYYCRSSLLNSSSFLNAYTSTGLYNGNISSWQQTYDRKAMSASMLSGFAYNSNRTAKTFTYDELNRLKESKFMVQNATTNVWGNVGDYQENFSYDANGNIMSLKRNGKAGGLPMDDLTYKYLDQANAVYPVSAQAPASAANITNKLGYVMEASGTYSTNYSDDIDGQTAINYTYDKIGNLKSDPSEGITSIKWNVYGKISEINKTLGGVTTKLTFLYDASGNRVYKKWQNTASPVVNDKVTYYVKDATGNSMGVYERTNSGTATSYTATYTLKEHPIYGSERIGTQNNGIVRSTNFTSTTPPLPQSQPQLYHSGSASYIMIPYANTTSTQVYTRDIYTVPSASIVLGADEYVQTVSGANTVEQRNSQAVACDDQGNVILSAFTYKLYSSSSYVGDRTVLYTNDSYSVAGISDVLNNAAEAQAVFMKKPGSEDEYYYFTIGTDGKPYYHTIDLTTGEMLNVNNAMDSNTGYGQTMALYEDRTGAGPSTLYLRRLDGGNTLLCPFTITESGITAQSTFLIGAAVASSSVCEMQISPGGTLMAIANNTSGGGELKLYALSADHQTLTSLGSQTMTPLTRSVEFSNNDVSLFFTTTNGTNTKLGRVPVATFSTAVATVMHTQTNSSMTGSIRRGVNGNIYYITGTTAKPGEATLNMFTSPDVSTTPVTNLLIGVIKGNLTLAPHKLFPYAQLITPVANTRVLDKKEYELKDHLGNVHATFKDYKVRFVTGSPDIMYEQNFNDATTGGFALAGGSPAGSTVTNANGTLAVYGTATGAQAVKTVTLPSSSGGKFLLSFNYLPGNCTFAQYDVTGINAAGNPYGGLQIAGRNDFMITVPSGISSFDLSFTYQDPVVNHTFYIDDILVKQLDVANAVLIATPLSGSPSNWIGGNLHVTYPGGGMKLAQATSGAGWYAATKSVNLIQDQLYKITVNVSNLSNMNPSQPAGSNKLFFGYENDEGTPWLDYSEGITGTTTGNYTYYVIPKTNRGNIFLGVSNGGGGYFECEIGSVTVEHIVAAFQPLYSSVLNNVTDYYAFGSIMPGRNYNSPNYRYGFNGQEKDDEVYGSGNLNTAEFWGYDTRLGRRWNMDPEPFDFMSEYSCFANNPIMFPDPLGNRVRYGGEKASKEDRRRIKDQVKERRQNDLAFDKEFRSNKKDKEITYQYEDMRENINIQDVGKSAVTGATVYDAVMDDPTGDKDKTRIIAWNIRLIKLPKTISFNGGEPTLSNDVETKANENAALMGITRDYSHRFKDDPIKSQIALWLYVNKNKSITITINQNINGGLEYSSAEDGVMSTSRLRMAREKEIKSAFKAISWINYKSQIKIVTGHNDQDQTKIQQN